MSSFRRHALVALAVVLVSSAGLVAAQDLSAAELARYSTQIAEGTAAQRVAAADALGRRGASRRAAVVPLLRARLRGDDEWRVRASSGRAISTLR